jgi:hypothetical protein
MVKRDMCLQHRKTALLNGSARGVRVVPLKEGWLALSNVAGSTIFCYSTGLTAVFCSPSGETSALGFACA